MPFIVTPKVDHLYPLPDGVDQKTLAAGEFSTVETAIAVASAALNVNPTTPRIVSEIVTRLSASVSVSVSVATETVTAVTASSSVSNKA